MPTAPRTSDRGSLCVRKIVDRAGHPETARVKTESGDHAGVVGGPQTGWRTVPRAFPNELRSLDLECIAGKDQVASFGELRHRIAVILRLTTGQARVERIGHRPDILHP